MSQDCFEINDDHFRFDSAEIYEVEEEFSSLSTTVVLVQCCRQPELGIGIPNLGSWLPRFWSSSSRSKQALRTVQLRAVAIIFELM